VAGLTIVLGFAAAALLAPLVAPADPFKSNFARSLEAPSLEAPLERDELGRDFLRVASHITAFPGLAIMLVVLGFNLLGDGLRDALDPRLKNVRIRSTRSGCLPRTTRREG
jgi:ABC-type dipeptide/oligopeptide/nickel transport system permease subunit